MSDHQTRTLADALADAEIVRVEELSGSGEWVDITRPKERPMSDDDVTERAVEMLQHAMASGAVAFVEKARAGEVDPSAPMTEALGDFPREFLSIRASLFDGLLVTPEHNEAIRADERGRCSVIHATLTDEALVAELVRRGVLVLREGTNDALCYCWTGERCDCSRRRRYVTEWEVDDD